MLILGILPYNNYSLFHFSDVVYSLQGTTEVEYLNFLGLWLRQANNRGAN